MIDLVEDSWVRSPVPVAAQAPEYQKYRDMTDAEILSCLWYRSRYAGVKRLTRGEARHLETISSIMHRNNGRLHCVDLQRSTGMAPAHVAKVLRALACKFYIYPRPTGLRPI
jgi:hypothetical protein